MTEQIRVDEVVTNIMYGLTNVIAEQERLNEAKAVLYMALHNVQMYREETALSTAVDNTAEWVRLFLASMAVRGCTPKRSLLMGIAIRCFLKRLTKRYQTLQTVIFKATLLIVK